MPKPSIDTGSFICYLSIGTGKGGYNFMDKQTLIDVITDQKKTGLPQHFVPRSLYEKVERLSGMKQILVLAGLRRVGKSTLLQEIRAKNKEFHYYINFDDERLIKFSTEDFQMLLEVFIELYGEQKTFYFDEIQNVKGWERFVRRLHDNGYKVYVTGSNASMFSKELGTHLTGRYVQMELYPFSFHEYVQYKDKDLLSSGPYGTTVKGKLKRLFRSYSMEGGIPEYVRTLEPEYLKSLYESVLYRDILVRYRISQERPIKELVYYLASNLGKEISYNNLKNLIGVGSPTTVSDYCFYLENSFLGFLINGYDRSLKRQIQSHKKLYWVDTALAHTVGFRFSPDRGRALENIVFIELKRRAKEIYFHHGKKECDFILRKGITIEQAIQVSSSLDQPETLQREKEGLIEAMEAYHLREGLILTEDQEKEEIVSMGRRKCRIHIQPVWKWLLGEK